MKAIQSLRFFMLAAAIQLAFPALAMPDCSDARIRRLADRGETIAAIAEKCGLDEEEVEEVLDAEPTDVGDAPKPPSGLVSGTPVSVCGCYGYVQFGYRQHFAGCQSGVVVATMCPGFCPAGGSPWHNVCQ